MSYILLEYECCEGHTLSSFEKRSGPRKWRKCGFLGQCNRRAVRILSPVAGKIVWGSAAVRGKSDPPPHGLAMDAVGRVGESVSKAEWKAERSAKWRSFDRQRRRKSGAPV